MAGILVDMSSDIQKLQQIKAEIASVKQELKGIDIRVRLDIKESVETRLKALNEQYTALVMKIAEAEGKIKLSVHNINKASDAIIKAQELASKAIGGTPSSNTLNVAPKANVSAETVSIQAQAKAYEDLRTEINAVLGTREANIKRMLDEKKAIDLINAEIKKITKLQGESGNLSSAQQKRLEQLNNSLLTHKAALADVRQVLSNNAKMDNAAATSMDALGQSLSRMRITYRGLTEEERKSPFGKELLSSINQADAKIKELDASIGNHARNVGNYKKEWNGLQYQMQMVARELPNFAINPQTGIISLTNNLPYLVDELKKAKDAHKAYIAEVKAGNKDLKAVPSVGKQILSSLFSWQTALIMGITLITAYRKEITEWVGGLFNAKDAVKELLSAEQEMALARKKAILDSTKERTELDLLYNKLKSTTISTQERNAAISEWIKKYPQHANIMDGELINLEKLGSAYQSLSKQITESAKARAYSDKITELEIKRYDSNFKRLNQQNTLKIAEEEYLKTKEVYDKLQNEYDKGKSVGQSLSVARVPYMNAKEEYEKQRKIYDGLEKQTNDYISKIGHLAEQIKVDDLFPQAKEGTEKYWEEQKSIALASIGQIENKYLEVLKSGSNKGIPSDVIKQYNDAIKLKSEAEKALKVYEDPSKQESAAEKLRKEQEKYSLLLNEQALNQARLSEDLQTQVDEARINAMKDGSKKTLAQMELNFEKEMQVIDRQKEDSLRKKIEDEKAKFDASEDKEKARNSKHIKKTFDPTGIVLSDDENKQYDDLYKAKIAEKEKEEKAYLDSLLEKHQDYTDQRLAIETKYNADIAALEEQRIIAVKNGDTNLVEQIDRAKAQATKNKGKELMSMDYDKLKESPEYVRAFENLKRTSSETLNSLLSQLENAKQTAAQVLSPNELREYTTTIQEIMDELDSRNPFQALIDRKNELAEAENALAIASAQLDAVQNRGAKIETGAKNIRLNEKTGKIESEKTYLSATEALKKYNEAKDEAVNANAKVEEAERKVDDVMGELFDSIKNVGSAIGGEAGEIIGIIGDVGQFALMAMDGVETASITAATAVQAVEKASVILAIIGAAIQIATKIASLFNGTDYMEEFRKELSKLNYELELAKLNAEISTDEKSIFGDDLWGNAIKNVDLANDALSRYNDTLDQIANRKKYTGFIGAMADAKGLKNTYDSLGDSIANMQLKIRHKTWFRSAKYASLKDAVPELFNEDGSINQAALEEFIGSDTFEKLSQENQKYLQEMSDYWKAYQDSVEQVKDYLSDIFGDLGGTLTDTLVDAFANGTDAAQAFTDSVSEMLEQMGKQMIFHAVFKDIFEKTQQQMLDVTQNENLSDDDKFKEYVDILGGMTDEVMGEQDKFNALLEAYQKMAAEKGIDIFKPSDSSKETLDSFVSQMQSAFTSLDVTAKDVSDNIYDYFRQSMINALYEKEYKSKMEELFKNFKDLSSDGLSESDMAQLGTQVDQYINEMLKGVEGVNSLFADKLKDAADIQSFVDNVKSAISSIEATAEDVTDNIFEYIRQQMVDKMFADTFQPQIEEFYKKVQAAMSDGSVTDSEKDALRKEAEKLANDITSAKDILSDTLGVTADNLKKEAEAEFKSFSDGILSSLYSAEVTAESISKNIADSMRQELIKAMYIEQYEPRIRAIWDKWKEYSSDGLVTDEERASIKDDINDLSKEVADVAKDISDAWTEAGDAVYDTFESFSNSIKSVLQNAETTAEDVAKNIYQFMRNALVNSMFAEQVQPQIKAWYDKYAEYMKDGVIDTTERKTLDEMIAEIQKAGMEIVDAANGLFPSLDTGAIQEVENAKQEWESFSDSMLNSLYDIEASAGDISDDMSEYMRKALIKAMYVNNYKPQMQKWYDEWQRAMGDDVLTSEEKQTLDSMKQEMLDGMKKEADAINQMFDSMYSQEASSKGFEGISQDTGEELNGRFTALQIAGEEIKNQTIKQTELLSSINDKLTLRDLTNQNLPLLVAPTLPNIAEQTRSSITNSYQSPMKIVFPDGKLDALTSEVSQLKGIVDEMRTNQFDKFADISEGVSIMAKNTPAMNTKLDNINSNIKKAL